ncbi:hypothetical protein HMPREF3113_03265 [Stenotrophomonas sp. HMSC10F06]|uniref:DUF3613 domain-containing protein n=2 Tax=Gammaproteobacteria TaxID=1236 RepID=UPI0008A160E1|nr:DUF3613 domain-containing protein [Stenotrophomonas sp. HMSC10F06]OFS96413.1 hypothetical protein HMPREF3113_03265 [Stenotrophomonas sp. HMSC10F06]
MNQLRRLPITFLHVGLPWLLMVVALPAMAQQAPLTGQMLGGQQAPPVATTTLPAPETPAPVPTYVDRAPAYTDAAPGRYMPPAPAPRSEIGQTTRDLLRMQAQGTHAGARLPILGDQAAASYARYLKSFEHEIPEFLKTSVKKDVGGSNEGG